MTATDVNAVNAVNAGPPPAGSLTPSAAGAGEPEPLSHRKILVVFGALMLTVLLAALDQTIVATALPTIVGDLQGLDHIAWVVTAYLLASTIVLPIYGKLGDLFGRKGLFQFAIVVFLVGSVLCGLAETMGQLIAFRAVQGVGAGGLMIGAQAIIADLVPPRQRGRYMGLIGAVFGLSSVAGPLLGGLFTDHYSWHWCFFVNVPLGILALIVTALVLKLPRRRVRPKLDVLGALFLAAASTCIVLGTSWAGTEYAWTDPVIIGLGVGAVLAAALFVVTEHHASEPIIPLRLFRSSVFTLSTLIGILVGMAMFGAIAYLPLFLQTVNGASATESGLLMLPMVAGIFVASVVSGRIISATGHYKAYPILGTAIAAVGMYLLSQMGETTSSVYNGVAMAVLGLGIGLVMPVLILVVQNSAQPRDLGAATSAANYFRQIGACLGTAAFGAVFVHEFTERTARALPSGAAVPDTASLTPEALRSLPAPIREVLVTAFAETIPPIFLYGVPVLVFGLLLAFFVKQVQLRDRPATAGAHGVEGGGVAPSEGLELFDDARAERSTEREDAIPGQRDGRLSGPVGGPNGFPGPGGPGSPGPGAGPRPVPVPGPDLAEAGTADGAPDQPYAPGHAPQAEHAPQSEHAPRPGPDAEPGQRGEGNLHLVHDKEPGPAGRFGQGGYDDRADAPPIPPGHIRVRLRQQDGVPIKGAVLTLLDDAGREDARSLAAGDGYYLLARPADGTHVLVARADHHNPRACLLEVNDGPIDLDVVLDGESGLRGIVHGPDGALVDGAIVTLSDGRGAVAASRSTDADGEYSFSDLLPGSYTLTVTAPTLQPAAMSVKVPETGQIHQDVHLVGGAELYGTARTRRDHRPIPDARVTLVDRVGRVLAETYTDARGHYEFPNLVQGDYTVVATCYPPAASGVTVAGGVDVEHDVELGYPEV